MQGCASDLFLLCQKIFNGTKTNIILEADLGKLLFKNAASLSA